MIQNNQPAQAHGLTSTECSQVADQFHGTPIELQQTDEGQTYAVIDGLGQITRHHGLVAWLDECGRVLAESVSFGEVLQAVRV